MVVLSSPKTTVGSFPRDSLAFGQLKERFLWGYPEFKGGNQVGDEADRDVRGMGRSTGSSGKPTKATDMDGLGERFRICSFRWQSHREYRCEFSSELLVGRMQMSRLYEPLKWRRTVGFCLRATFLLNAAFFIV